VTARDVEADMSAWTVFFILAVALFLLFAIPFWTGRRYRAAMRAYRGLKVGQASPWLYLQAMVHGGGFGLGVVVMGVFFTNGVFNAWRDAANGRLGLFAIAFTAFVCLLAFRMGEEEKR